MQSEILLLFRPDSPLMKTFADFLEMDDSYIIHQSDNPSEILKSVDSLSTNQKLPYSLIIMEIMLTKIDGVEMLKRLVEKEIKIPVILMSAHMNLNQGKQFEQKGAYKYFDCPTDLFFFIDTVEEAILYFNKEVRTQK